MNTSEYITKKTKTESVQQIKNLSPNERQGIIINAGEWKTFEEGTPEEIRKPSIGISIKGVVYDWILNQTTNERLAEEIGSYDTEQWVGCIVKFLIDKSGDYEYITATLIQKKAIEEETV